MKNSLIILLICLANAAGAQSINWSRQAATSKHLASFQAGLDYGLTFGAGYGYRLSTKIPVLLNAEFSFPSGQNVFDDFKTKIGGQIALLHTGDFHFSARVYGVYRRYHTDFVRMDNFGSDLSGVVGYYRKKWFVAGEVGFDKAIVTHFKHGRAYRDIYPGVQDGWYEPATGGNFYYGLQTGVAFGKNGITLKGGRVLTQDFHTAPLLPFYAQLGYSRWF